MFPLNIDYDQLKHNSGNYHTPFNVVQLLFLLHTAKLLSADWLRQRAFFLNHEGTSAAMASRYVEADEEFIEELRNTSEKKTKKEVRTTGLTFSNNGQRREEKMSNLKATKYQSLTKLSIILPFM